jgi:hypothetical protein
MTHGTSARRGPIGWCRHAEAARRDRDDGDGVARHVEELNRVAFFGDTRYDVPLHDRADVAGAQTVFARRSACGVSDRYPAPRSSRAFASLM